MLNFSSFLISLLHILPFANSALIALFIFFFSDWRKNHSVRALLIFFIINPVIVLVWSGYEAVLANHQLPILDFLTMLFFMVKTPLIYNYMHAVASGRCMGWQKWTAFYVPLLVLIVGFHFVIFNYGHAPFIASLEEVKPYLKHPDIIGRFITFGMVLVYGGVMIVGACVNYKRYQSDIEKDFSSSSSPRQTLWWMYLTVFLYIIYFLASITAYLNSALWLQLLVFAVFVLLNVALAFFGYSYKSVYSPEFQPLSQLVSEEVNREAQILYLNMQQCFERLCDSEQIWRNSNLASTDVIEKLNTNRTYFSQFLQDVYKTNFRTYINTLRVQEAQKNVT